MAEEYGTLNLNQYLQSVNSFLGSSGYVPAYDFQSNNERGVITNTFLGNFSFNKGTGGTLTLGGTSNGNGVLLIKNSSGTVIVEGNNVGHTYYDAGGTKQIAVDATGFHAYSGGTAELVKVNNTGFHTYDLAGSTTFEILGTGLFGYGTALNVINIAQVPGGATFGVLGYSASQGAFWVASGDDKNLYIIATGAGTTTLAGNNGVRLVTLNNTDIVLAADDDVQIIGDDDVTITALGDDVVITANSDVTVSTGGDFVVNGTPKSAIVPTSQGHKALYCVEAPDVWFMDFIGEDKVLDPLFEEVTEAPYKYIKAEDGWQVWGKRKGFADIRFEDKSVEQFTLNTQFWNRPQELYEQLLEAKNKKDALAGEVSSSVDNSEGK